MLPLFMAYNGIMLKAENGETNEESYLLLCQTWQNTVQ